MGSGSEKLNAKTSSKTSTIEPPGVKPQPAVPGGGVANGVASLGVGYLVDRYVTPYLMDAARRASGSLSAGLSYKLGKISEAELAEALRFIRDGNGSKWGERINEIRRLQKAAKEGKKTKVTPNLGQRTGILYAVTLEIIYKDKSTGANYSIVSITRTLLGPIGGSAIIFDEQETNGSIGVIYGSPLPNTPIENNYAYKGAYFYGYDNFSAGLTEVVNKAITNIRRIDGASDEVIDSVLNTGHIGITTLNKSTALKWYFFL